MSGFRSSSSAAPPMKDKSTKRSWSDREERFLIIAFKEIISTGWKAQNGYKSGFLNQLEKKLKELLPTTDLRADPHISSKYTAWKRAYYQLHTALSSSGFNWNSSTFMVEAEPEEWAAFLLQHKNHHVIRGKAFPLYDDWVEIFGKDKATGHGAMDPAAAADDATIHLDDDPDSAEENSYHPDNVVEEEANESVAGTPRPSANKSTGSKKRKRVDKNDDALVEVISTFCADTSSAIKEVSTRLGSEVDACRRREALFEAVGLLPIDITEEEHINVCFKLAKDPKGLDMFFGMPMSAQMSTVKMAIKGSLKH